MNFTDRAPLAGTKKTADGYLVATVRAARTGIQDYLGSEVGMPEKSIVKVYRPEDQVFDKDSMASYAHKPVTNDHPRDAVTADNYTTLSRGYIGDEVARDGEWIRIPLMLTDAKAIRDVEGGKCELSAGYTCDLDMTAGITPDGLAYDARQTNIRINHVAIVQQGRAGPKARIGDAAPWGASPSIVEDTKPMNLRLVMVDGLQVETTDAGATAIEKLTATIAARDTALATAATVHAQALAAKDAELAQKDAKIDDLATKVLSNTDLDARVRARADLVNTAVSIVADLKTDGLSDMDIRKAVLTAKLGDAAITGKADAYIEARFDGVVDAHKAADPVRDAMLGRTAPPAVGSRATVDSAHNTMVTGMTEAWKTTGAA